jgi:hypothetical protein
MTRVRSWIECLAFATVVFAATGCDDRVPSLMDTDLNGLDTLHAGDLLGDGVNVAPSLPAVFVRGLESPLRMVAVPGAVLATDSRLNMVLQIDPVTMSYARGFHTRGKPLSIGYHGRFVYVGNVDRQTVEVFHSESGNLLGNFGAGAVKYPSDMAVDHVGRRVYVVDAGHKHVAVFDVTGTRVGTISGPGATPDRLGNPIGIAVDPFREEVLVSDYGTLRSGSHASIKAFGFDGAFRYEITGEASCTGCDGGFSRPQGLAIGMDGRIYMADALLGKVLVFDQDGGAFVGEIGGDDFLRLPTDVTVGADGDLFIANNLGKSFEVVRTGASR